MSTLQRKTHARNVEWNDFPATVDPSNANYVRNNDFIVRLQGHAAWAQQRG